MQKFKNHIDILNILLLLLLSAALLASVALNKTWPDTHDDFRYLHLFDQFRDVFMSGTLYPRWLPDTYGGFGSPIFVFYQPGFFYVSLLFSFITSNILTAMHCSVIFFLFAGALGAYLLAKKISDRATGLFCGILFLLTPYLYVNLYVRGDLSELSAMMLCPWPFYFLLRIKDRVANGAKIGLAMAPLAVSVAGVIMCHPATALFFMPVFMAIAFYVSFEEERKKQRAFLMASGFAIFIALALSSPYWLTAFVMKTHVNYQNALAGVYSAERHTVNILKFFSRNRGFGDSGASGASGGMPFQLGLPHFILALAGLLANRKNKFLQAAFAMYILLILAMSPASAYFWKNIKL